MSSSTPIAGHPDLAELRMRYERASETPTAQMADGLTVLGGLFVALSPWITGFAGTTPSLALNNLVTGLTAVMLGLSFAAAYHRTHGIAWTCPVLGAWVIVSVFVMSGTAVTLSTVLCNVIGGAVLVLAGLGTMAPAMASRASS
ncbi:membrane protein [Saccharopolyspora subtropica]|uniref:Membrane protein n=1 Tax=Saccharopolyspora thermophila TaxID=89367 RepID=A0A917NHC3_9PSEU|nr:SPW repeat protein [Saccharopolyspora subtropica]GGI98056.1 membrane protein [Saccharopolyspora subtropica]